MEVAIRYATYEEVGNALDEEHFENAIAANWFFDGHRNKLTADVTRFSMDQTDLGSLNETRFRLQWDLSF